MRKSDNHNAVYTVQHMPFAEKKTPDCSEQRESKTKKQQLQFQCENEELKSHSEDENKDKNQKCPYAVAGVA